MTQLTQALQELTGDIQVGNHLLTTGGGKAIKLTNKTGAVSVRGTILEIDSGVNNAFEISDADSNHTVGIVYENGVADGAECWVIFTGRAQVLLKNATASTRGNWVETSDVEGRADATNANPPGGGIAQIDNHMMEIGHCMETNAGGVDQLVWIQMHFL